MSGLLNILTESVNEVPRIEFPNLFDKSIIVNRVAFNLFGVDIYWYGVIIAVGVILAFIYAMHKCKQFGLIPDHVFDVAFVAIIFGFIGARAYYCIFIDTDINFFDLRHGGLAIYGGIIAAAIAAAITCVIHKVNLPAMFDVGGLGLLIGQCIGRWGNFVNQEAFGANTDLPWGMISSKTMSYIAENFDELGGQVSSYAPVHPCFLYESIWCVICFVILHIFTKHRKFDGEVFLMYIGLYGLGRFFIESTRTDSLYIANIRVSQLVAGTCVFTALVLIIIFRSMASRSNYKLFCDTELSKQQLAALEGYEENEKAKKELKKKIAEAKRSGESFAELEKEYDEKFGKTAKEAAKKKADEIAAEKKELKAKIKEAEKAGKKDEAAKLKNEFAKKFGGIVTEEEEAEDENYTSILGDDDEEAETETAEAKADEKPEE